MICQSAGAVTLNWYVRLDVGLVEAREQSVRLVRLEVGVDVLGAVLRVDEAMEAIAGLVIVVDIVDLEHHRAAQQVAGQGQPIAGPVGLEPWPLSSRRSIDPPRKSRKSGPLPVVLKRTVDVAAIGGITGDQIEANVISDVGDTVGPLGGLDLGQHVARGRLTGRSCNLRQDDLLHSTAPPWAGGGPSGSVSPARPRRAIPFCLSTTGEPAAGQA